MALVLIFIAPELYKIRNCIDTGESERGGLLINLAENVSM